MDRTHIGIGKLAFRVEGQFWNAYFVLGDEPDGSWHFIGSVIFDYINGYPERKESFIETMQKVINHIILKTVPGVIGEPQFDDPKPAPKNECGES